MIFCNIGFTFLENNYEISRNILQEIIVIFLQLESKLKTQHFLDLGKDKLPHLGRYRIRSQKLEAIL